MTKINPVVVHDVSETFTVLFDEGTRLFWIGLLYGILALPAVENRDIQCKRNRLPEVIAHLGAERRITKNRNLVGLINQCFVIVCINNITSVNIVFIPIYRLKDHFQATTHSPEERPFVFSVCQGKRCSPQIQQNGITHPLVSAQMSMILRQRMSAIRRFSHARLRAWSRRARIRSTPLQRWLISLE